MSSTKQLLTEVLTMNYEQFKTLKYKQRIKASIHDTYSIREMILEVGRRTKSKKYNTEKLTLIPTHTTGELNTFACKYYLYARERNPLITGRYVGGSIGYYKEFTEEEMKEKNVTLAHGNMAANLYEYEVIK